MAKTAADCTTMKDFRENIDRVDQALMALFAERWSFINRAAEIKVGLGISFYPYIVPGALTIREAAAPPESLAFLLVGAVVLVPMILGYTAYAYWVFRGKVDPEEGYH